MSNVERYQEVRNSIADSLEKTLFTARLIGVLSAKVSEKEWQSALELAAPPAGVSA